MPSARAADPKEDGLLSIFDWYLCVWVERGVSRPSLLIYSPIDIRGMTCHGLAAIPR